jgi:hypothetical protein
MPISEERIKGLETQSTNIRERLSKIEGRLDAPSKSPNAILIAVLSIVGIAVIWYWGWVGTQIVDHGKSLISIQARLVALGLQSQASLPQSEFEKALPEIRSVVADARKDRISVPPTVIEGLRSKLLASNSQAPDFWPTVSEFVSYRSSLSYYAGAGQISPVPPMKMYYSSARLLPNCTDSLPKPMRVTDVLSPNEAVNSRGLYENCRFVLDSPTQDQTLNGILRRSTPVITFKNCIVEYRGGEINLILAWDKEPFTWTLVGTGPKDPSKILHVTVSGPAIQFENCLFIFLFQNPPPPNGQRFSTTLLAENTNSVALPVSP